jgi:uncharacterized protein YdhG (YjbR/CyaY superfamily)
MNQANSATNSYDGMFLRRRSGYDNNYQDDATKGRAIKWGRDVVATEDVSLTKTDDDSIDQILVEMKQEIDGNDIALLDRIVKACPEIMNQISYNLDCDFDEGATILVYATYNKHLEAVKVLVANNADVDVIFILDGIKKTLIYQVADLNDTSILKEISNKSTRHVNTKCHSCTPLHKAVVSGNIDVAKLLISKGADLNSYTDCTVDLAGATPLMYAVLNLNVSMVELLLKEGADVTKGAHRRTDDNLIEETEVVEFMREYIFSQIDKVDVKIKKFEILALLSKYGAKIDLQFLQDIKDE